MAQGSRIPNTMLLAKNVYSVNQGPAGRCGGDVKNGVFPAAEVSVAKENEPLTFTTWFYHFNARRADAATLGQICTLEWAHSRGLPDFQGLMDIAAWKGRYEGIHVSSDIVNCCRCCC